jgi:hypothetical protein
MNVNTQSVIKAGGVGAAINVILGLLSAVTLFIPEVGLLTWPFLCCGGVLIPVLAGALYGRFTPGRETMGESAAGGALSGFAAGLMYGVFSGIASAVYTVVQGGEIVDALSATAGSLVGSCCGAIIFGSLLGAVGGAIWNATQGNKGM